MGWGVSNRVLKASAPSAPASASRPRAEALEVRVHLTVFADSNVLDDGPGSLPGSAVNVVQVYVNGPGLTTGTTAEQAAFRSLAGMDAALGYAMPAGAAQARPLPWAAGVNGVSLRFNRDVAAAIARSDLRFTTAARGTVTPDSFAYDPLRRVATWTLRSPLQNDKVRLLLDDALLPGLDGEWQNGSPSESYPSGDGTPGGDFDFRFAVLAGDATGDGRVNALDLASVTQRLNRVSTRPGTGLAAYGVFADLSADGRINALDVAAARQRLNRRLPAAEPAGTGLRG